MMTDPAVKIALALSIVVAGYFASSIFRRDKPQPTLPPQPLAIAADAKPSPAGPRATRLTSARDLPAPPSGIEDSRPKAIPESRWGASMESMLPVGAAHNEPRQTHRIVDGDTLPNLAARYLGAASRADELFAANRDVLFDPKLLPIGVTLKIPAR
jgi:nucleoid-associated protein YgaU